MSSKQEPHEVAERLRSHDIPPTRFPNLPDLDPVFGGAHHGTLVRNLKRARELWEIAQRPIYSELARAMRINLQPEPFGFGSRIISPNLCP